MDKKFFNILIIFLSLFMYTNRLDAVVLTDSITKYNIQTYKHDGGNTKFYVENGNNVVENSGNASYGFYEYIVKGLDPNKLYSIKVDLKTTNVTGDGAIVGTDKWEENNHYNLGYSDPLPGTSNWTTKTIVTEPTRSGQIIIKIGISCNFSGHGTGKVQFKNIRIMEAEQDNDLVVGNSKNKKIKMVLFKSDYNRLNLNENTFNNVLNKLEKCYDAMAELTGGSSYGQLRPYYNRTLTYNLANAHNYGGLAGFPIVINKNYGIDNYLKDTIKENNVHWGFLHEMGHNFDLTLFNYNNTYYTESSRFSFDSEQTASFYPLYVMEKLNYTTSDVGKIYTLSDWLNLYQKSYNENIKQGKYSGDGLSYLLSKIKVSNKTDWESFKKAYNWINSLSKTDYNKYVNTTSKSDVMWLLKKIDDYSSANVRSIFSNNDIKAIFGEYNPITNISVVATSSLVIKDGYKIETKTNDNNDILTYESLDETIATVNDFGVIKIKNKNADGVTIKISSFLNQSVEVYYKFKINNTNANYDQDLHKCIIDKYNKLQNTNLNYNTYLNENELSVIKDLTCTNKNIVNTEELKKLTNLTSLNLSSNKIRSIDLSKNKKLTSINLKNNQISSIIIPSNTKIVTLDLSSNKIQTIKLINNDISNINLSNNILLETIDLSMNKIKSVNLNNNSNLKSINLANNLISSINLSTNTKLDTLNLSLNKIKTIDLSKNINLRNLSLVNNEISNINLTKNTKLETIDLSINKLNNINLSKNINLKSLNITNNEISGINLSSNTKLDTLDLSLNKIKTIDLSKNHNIKTLNLMNNRIESLALNNNLYLENLDLSNNLLTELNLSNNKNIVNLNIEHNQIKALDISNNSKLKNLMLTSNVFESNLVVYKDDIINLTSALKLFENKYAEIKSLTSENENLILDNHIDSSLKGDYKVIARYAFDLEGYNIEYDEIINVYVIEVDSSRYKIENDKIFVSVDTNDIILDNINIKYGQAFIEDNLYIIKDNDRIIKQFELVRSGNINENIIEEEKKLKKNITLIDISIISIATISFILVIVKLINWYKLNKQKN